MNMTGTIFMTEVECANCITHFGVDQALIKRCRETGRTFYCPLGHGNVHRDSEVDRLKKQNQALTSQLTWAEQEAERNRVRLVAVRREKASIKGQLTKTRKRIVNGACPCCNRTFANVARHVDSKHPDFKAAVK